MRFILAANLLGLPAISVPVSKAYFQSLNKAKLCILLYMAHGIANFRAVLIHAN